MRSTNSTAVTVEDLLRSFYLLGKDNKTNQNFNSNLRLFFGLCSRAGTEVNKLIVGETILHRACRNGQTSLVAGLLALPNIDPNVKSDVGLTALHIACLNHSHRASEYDRSEVIENLLNHPKTLILDGVGTQYPQNYLRGAEGSESDPSYQKIRSSIEQKLSIQTQRADRASVVESEFSNQAKEFWPRLFPNGTGSDANNIQSPSFSDNIRILNGRIRSKRVASASGLGELMNQYNNPQMTYPLTTSPRGGYGSTPRDRIDAVGSDARNPISRQNPNPSGGLSEPINPRYQSSASTTQTTSQRQPTTYPPISSPRAGYGYTNQYPYSSYNGIRDESNVWKNWMAATPASREHRNVLPGKLLELTNQSLFDSLNNPQEFKRLLNGTPESQNLNQIVDKNGLGLLYRACAIGNAEVVQALLDRGANPNQKFGKQDAIQLPLTIACYYGHLKVVEALIKNGAEVNAQDQNQISALHIACAHNKDDIVKKLLDSGASVTSKDSSDRTPFAFGFDKPEITKLLTDKIDRQLIRDNWVKWQEEKIGQEEKRGSSNPILASFVESELGEYLDKSLYDLNQQRNILAQIDGVTGKESEFSDWKDKVKKSLDSFITTSQLHPEFFRSINLPKEFDQNPLPKTLDKSLKNVLLEVTGLEFEKSIHNFRDKLAESIAEQEISEAQSKPKNQAKEAPTLAKCFGEKSSFEDIYKNFTLINSTVNFGDDCFYKTEEDAKAFISTLMKGDNSDLMTTLVSVLNEKLESAGYEKSPDNHLALVNQYVDLGFNHFEQNKGDASPNHQSPETTKTITFKKVPEAKEAAPNPSPKPSEAKSLSGNLVQKLSSAFSSAFSSAMERMLKNFEGIANSRSR